MRPRVRVWNFESNDNDGESKLWPSGHCSFTLHHHCDRMRYYEGKYPEVDELVMVQVRQIAEMGAYVKLVSR